MRDEELTTPGGIRVEPASLTWRFSRSPGPGGQHVNTTETKVELRCRLADAGLPETLLARLVAKLGTDEVRVVSATHRSQRRNRQAAWERLAEQLDAAAVPERPRRATRPSRGSVERRLAAKKHESSRKADRRWRPGD